MSALLFNSVEFQKRLDSHQLSGSRCRQCGALYLPPHPLCTACYSEEVSWETLSGRGTLIAFTVVHIAPSAMIQAGYGRDNPYVTGIVRLVEGPAISAQILGVDALNPESIEIGVPVQVTFIERQNGESHTSLAFEVVI